MENFRRPLRKDARTGMPAGFKRYMRHDFYWGFLGHLGPIAFFAWTVHLVSGGLDRDQPGVSPEQRERNKRLLQVHQTIASTFTGDHFILFKVLKIASSL